MSSPSRILFVKNLNYNTSGADLYEVFGRYGAIRQVRIGDAPQTRGTAYVVFEEIGDARNALNNLNGFNLQDRYIIGAFPLTGALPRPVACPWKRLACAARRRARTCQAAARHRLVIPRMYLYVNCEA